MKMFADLRAFLYELYEDYSEYNTKHGGNIENCFYYRYFKKQKEEQAAAIGSSGERLMDYAKKTRPNKYVLLHAAYLAFKNDRITADEYKDFYVKVSEGKKKTAEFLAADIRNADDAAEFNSALEKRLLKNCVRDFFDNAGFKKLEDDVEKFDKAAFDNSSVRSRYRERSKSFEQNTDNIEMLHEYLLYTNEKLSDEPSRRSGEITEELKERCVRHYEAFNKNPNSKAFMPLYFDSQSGAGIYIIGKNRFHSELAETFSENCKVCIVRFMDVGSPVESGGNYNAMELIVYVDICGYVLSAFRELEAGIRSGGYYNEFLEQVSDADAHADEEIARSRMEQRRRIIEEQKRVEERKMEKLRQIETHVP